MKKLILISLVSLALFGCEDDKVTKEYLVGDWRCNWEAFERMDSGREESYGDAVDKSEFIRTYKIMDGKLYHVYDGDKQELYDVDEINSNPTNEILNDNSTFTGQQKLEKISNDQYRYVIALELKNNSNTTNVIDIRSKQVTTCTRIK